MKYRLLIVEDEELLRRSLCVMIDWESLNVEIVGTVENGVKALEFLESGPADIVMTDIRMPVMDGLELAGEIQSRFPQTKTVLCSAYDEFEFARKGIAYGVYGYLLKSQEEEEIEAFFRQMLARLEAERSLNAQGEDDVTLWEQRERLAALLQSKPYSANMVESLLPDCRIYSSARGMSAVLAHLDEPGFLREELGDIAVRQLVKVMGEQLLEQVEWEKKGYLLHTGETALLLWDGDCEESSLVALQEGVVRELRAVEGTLPITLTLSCSDAGQVEQWGSSLRTAETLLKTGFFRGPGQVLTGSAEPEMNALPAARIQEELAKAEAYLSARDTAGLRAQLDRLAEEWEAAKITDAGAVRGFALHIAERFREMSPQDAMAERADYVRLFANRESIRTILNAAAEIAEQTAPPGEERQQRRIVQRVRGYLEEHYAEDISLERAAALVSVHPVHLSRLFRQETGETFKAALTGIRMRRAKELLREIDLRVYEISEQVGYRKPRYFSELFKSETGMTPLEYRERHGMS